MIMTQTTTEQIQVLGVLNTAEARLLADTERPADNPQVLAVCDRLGALALESDAFAIVIKENNAATVETALHYVSLRADKLGAPVPKTDHRAFGLQSPGVALKTLRDAERLTHGVYLMNEERAAVHDVFKNFLVIFDEKQKYRSVSSAREHADDAVAHRASDFLTSKLSLGSYKVGSVVVGTMAAGAMRNPQRARTFFELVEEKQLLAADEADVVGHILADVQRLDEQDMPDMKRARQLDNMVGDALTRLPYDYKRLKLALLSFGAGATLDVPERAARYMAQLDDLTR